MMMILNSSIFLASITTSTTVHAFVPTVSKHLSSTYTVPTSRLFSVTTTMGVRELYTRRSTSSSSGGNTATVEPETPSRQHDQHHQDSHSRHDTWNPNPTTQSTTTTPTTDQSSPHPFNEWQQSVLQAEMDLHHALLSGDLYTLEALWEEGCLMVDPYDRHMDKQDALEVHYHGLLPVDHYQVLPDSIQIMAVPGRPDVALVIVNVHFVGDMFPGHFVNEYVQYRRVWRRQQPLPPPPESSPSSSTSSSSSSSSSSPPPPNFDHHHCQEPFSPTVPWWQVMREEASLMVPEHEAEDHGGHNAQRRPPTTLY